MATRQVFEGLWAVTTVRSFSVKVARGGADSLRLFVQNDSVNSVSYQQLNPMAWDSHLDEIFGVTAGVPSGRSIALGALDHIPMHDGLYTNQGVAGGVATLMAGTLANTLPFIPASTNTIYQQLTGYLRLRAGATFCTYNGPFTVGMWLYPTAVSVLSPIWAEQNAGVTHYWQVYIDTDRRIGIRGNNGTLNTGNIKDAAGPVLPLNQWSLVFITYNAPNYQYHVVNGSTVTSSAATSVGAGGMPTFVDANGTYVGNAGAATGYFGNPFSFSSVTYNQMTTAPIETEAMRMIGIEATYSDNTQLLIETGTIATNASLQVLYGKGGTKELPASIVISLFSPGANSYGRYSIIVEKDETT